MIDSFPTREQHSLVGNFTPHLLLFYGIYGILFGDKVP